MLLKNTDLRLVNERINLDIVDVARKSGGVVTVDDILPAAAARSVILPFKTLEEEGMRHITLAMKQFVRGHSRFLNFTKEGIIEGLHQQWLPSLEGDDKDWLIKDLKLIESFDENGVIRFNEKLYNLYLSHPKPDTERYGTQPYSPVMPSKRNSIPKVRLSAAPPIQELAEKLAPYIEWYKKYWPTLQLYDMEGYKWEAVRHFQENFHIDAENLAENLKEALSKEVNLLSGPMYIPKSVLIRNAQYSPEEVRAALIALFDESRFVYERVDEFLTEFRRIHNANRQAGLFRENERDNQSERSVSVYLAFRHPDKHYLYKYKMWTDFVDMIGFECQPLTHFRSKLFGYNLYCDQIRNVLLADAGLVRMLKGNRPDDNSNGHMLTQDFIYCIASHFIDFDKKPRTYDDPT